MAQSLSPSHDQAGRPAERALLRVKGRAGVTWKPGGNVRDLGGGWQRTEIFTRGWTIPGTGTSPRTRPAVLPRDKGTLGRPPPPHAPHSPQLLPVAVPLSSTCPGAT